ncbi:MAG: plasmid recombination protein [Lachnospiraceae bacterium]|nr:plasmid recombination protein [Lachnospiraceae bacterium]
MATISTHNGSQISRKHNMRDKSVVSKEKHIDPNGWHEIWLDKSPKKAYKEVFEKAVIEYNNKQKRNDRKITDYYQKICKDKKKHSIYEMICGVYGDNITPELSHDILYDYAKDFQVRHPNLYVTGIYFHADEEGKAPHIHIDYFPVAQMKKGMALQNSLVKALEQEGFMSGEKYKDTAQIKFEHSENSILESICNKYGFDVEHPQRDMNVEHLDTAVYKKTKEIENLEIEKFDLEDEIVYLNQQRNDLENHSEPLYFKKLLNLLLDFIEQFILPFLPENLASKISDIINQNTYGELETALNNEISNIEMNYDNLPDITD